MPALVVNAIVRPSGDQSGSPAFEANRRRSWPSASTTKIFEKA